MLPEQVKKPWCNAHLIAKHPHFLFVLQYNRLRYGMAVHLKQPVRAGLDDCVGRELCTADQLGCEEVLNKDDLGGRRNVELPPRLL